MACPEWREALLKRLGAMLVPLALVSVAYPLRLSALSRRLKKLCLGLHFKLLLAPLVILVTVSAALHRTWTLRRRPPTSRRRCGRLARNSRPTNPCGHAGIRSGCRGRVKA